MNKKFSTLMAGLLLAGGVIGTANAESLLDVADNGKYYQLKMSMYSNGTTWANTPTTWDAQYLSVDADGPSFLPSADPKVGYWTIKDVLAAGEALPSGTTGKIQLINAADGKPLTITISGNKISAFYTEAGPGGDASGLVCYVGTTRYQIGGITTPGATQDNITFGNYSSPGSAYWAGLEAEEIQEVAITATELNSMLTKNAFGLVIGSAKDKEYTDLQGNVFTGEIEAKTAATTGTYYFYRKADKKYIVLTENVWSANTANLDGKERSAYAGYKFEAISEHAFGLLTAPQKVAQAEFQVLKSYDFNDTDSLIVTLPNACVGEMPASSAGVANWSGDAASANANKDKGVRLYVSNVDNKNYLTVIEYAKANDRLADQKDDAYATYQVGASVPYVKLGQSNIVDFASTFAGKIWNITNTDGKVLSPNVNWAEADAWSNEFDPATQVQLNKPEGHWLPYYNAADDYGFINRESGIKWNITDGDWVIRSTNTSNLYEVYSSKYWTAANQWYQVYITEAKDAELGFTENGYAKFDEAKEALDGKYLTLTNGVTGETVYVGKDADDNVILTSEKSNAIEFRIKDLKHNYTDHDGLAGIDTLQHITSYLAKADLTTDQDTVQFYHYRLVETFSEKYLVYNEVDKKFVLSEASLTENGHEDFRRYKFAEEDTDYSSTFVLKETANGTYNLISNYNVEYDYCDHTTSPVSYSGNFDNEFNANLFKSYWASTSGSEKMYGAFQTATLANMAYIYNYNDNDRFALVNVDAPEYMTITGSQDTVKISLKAQPNFFLYKDGTFLGMEHVADVEDMKPAMFVDTAYVRNNTYRPQYLLAMNGKHVEPVWDNNPSHTIPHLLAPDTTYGRFLINAVDSAEAWTGTVKTNPYIHEQLGNNYYYRLVFVDGYHTGDKLFLNTAKAKTTIDLSNNNDKVCTFAFRYVDESREGVKIETTYDGKTRGWLKYQNNVPVVTPDYEDAHVFTVDNTTTDAPTANEEISTSSVVVAGTNGAVVVKGAEGKNVIVSTILGKVVANEVISSDNAQIATPAGIVVVSVDGESFKVVVK